jgi:cellulose synthase (UDP-forming)
MSPEIVTLSDSILFCAVAIFLILACSMFLDSRKASDRILFGGILIVMLLNYLFFRATRTLPEFDGSAYSLWPRIYIGFETIIIFYTILSIVFFFRRTDHSGKADESERTISQMETPPAVDVFICTYNEELPILERTILSAKVIDYDNYTVWVLDDGRRDWLRQYCEDVDVRYLRRDDNIGAKGGNINNALRESAGANAPYILILDADFAPQRSILKRTIGQFADPKIGLIQTPQFYYNADPVQHNLLASKAWVDDQRIFFDVMQPSKDGWGAAFCVGTSCIVRRDALELIGGMPQETVTEDIHLTYRLMQKGLRTRWLNERLSVGLSAETLSGYITQRCRWCLGTIQVALLKDGPFLGRGYTLMQRLHYFHGLLFWFCRPFILLLLAAPILYYFMGLPAILMEPEAFFMYALPMVGGMWAFHYWVSDRRSLPLFTEVSQMVSAIPITVAIFHAILRPFGRPFKVTDKGQDRSQVTVLYPLAIIFLSIIVLTFVGMLNGPLLNTYHDLDGFSVAWGMVVMIYAFVSMLVCIELPRIPLDDIRFPLALRTRVGYGSSATACLVEEISVHDARMVIPEARVSKLVDPGDLLIFSPFQDLDVVGKVTAADHATSRFTMSIVALKDRRNGGEIRKTAKAVRETMIERLFSEMPEAMPARARPGEAVAGLMHRMFGKPDGLMSEAEGLAVAPLPASIEMPVRTAEIIPLMTKPSRRRWRRAQQSASAVPAWSAT